MKDYELKCPICLKLWCSCPHHATDFIRTIETLQAKLDELDPTKPKNPKSDLELLVERKVKEALDELGRNEIRQMHAEMRRSWWRKIHEF